MLAAWALARVLDLAVVAALTRRATRFWARGDVAAALSSWDGRWYQRITEQGYPARLVTAPGVRPPHTTLAFFPLYPGLVAGLRRLTGLGFVPVGLAVALAAGAGAAVLVPRLVRPWLGRGAALRTGVLWAVSPFSAVSVLTYSDTLFALLAVASLLALTRRRYGLLVPLGVLAGLTRGVLAPFVVVLAVHLWCRRETLRTTASRTAAVAGLAGAVLASGLWPLVVALRSGRWDTYLLAEQAWQQHLVPLLPWGWAVLHLGDTAVNSANRDVVLLVAFVAAALALAGLRLPWPRELALWGIASLVYLVLAAPPIPSFARFTLPLVTLAAPVAVWARDRWSFAVVVGGCLLAQLWWLQDYLPWIPGHHVAP